MKCLVPAAVEGITKNTEGIDEEADRRMILHALTDVADCYSAEWVPIMVERIYLLPTHPYAKYDDDMEEILMKARKMLSKEQIQGFLQQAIQNHCDQRILNFLHSIS